MRPVVVCCKNEVECVVYKKDIEIRSRARNNFRLFSYSHVISTFTLPVPSEKVNVDYTIMILCYDIVYSMQPFEFHGSFLLHS